MISWWGWLIVAYCLGSWLVLFAALRMCPEGDRFELDFQPPGRLRKVLLAMLLLLAAPVVLPIGVYYCARELYHERRQLRRLLRTHRDYLFQPVESLDLPYATLAYFDQHSPELVALGFEDLGNYLLKGEPAVFHGRCFRHASGTVFATLCELYGHCHFSFVSVFADGVVMETSSVEGFSEMKTLQQRGGYLSFSVVRRTLDEAYQQHLAEAARLESNSRCRLRSFAAEQLRELYTYIGRKFSAELHAIGRLDEVPPPAELPAETGPTDELMAEATLAPE